MKWELIGKKFLELYEVQECEENVNHLRFKSLDDDSYGFFKREIDYFHVHIVYEGKNARCEIKPEINYESNELCLKVVINNGELINSHFVCKFMKISKEQYESIVKNQAL